MKTDLEIGDAVEVRFEHYDRYTNSHKVKWHPATIQHVNFNEVAVVFSDSTRLALPLNQGRFRRMNQ